MERRDREPDPVFMLISKEAVPQKGSLLSVGGAAVTLAGTAFTAFAYGIGNFALRPEFYQKVHSLHILLCFCSSHEVRNLVNSRWSLWLLAVKKKGRNTLFGPRKRTECVLMYP